MTAIQQEYNKLQETIRHNKEMEAQGRLGLSIESKKSDASNKSADANVKQAETSQTLAQETIKQNRYRNIGSLVDKAVAIVGGLFK